PAHASASFTLGTDNFYLSVGDYDYLPYGYVADPGFAPPPVNFYVAMADYGSWVTVAQFGQVWRPYASYGWRPYLYGHWVFTAQYGPMWVGYEPWAWIGYHYGDWVFTPNFGWVWIPGYDWHPCHVAWAQGYNTIGWSPLPPPGFDYSQGSLGYRGPNNQFSYNDNDFGYSPEDGSYAQGGPYFNPLYQPLYYNPPALGNIQNLWIFINVNSFGDDDYNDDYLGPDYTRFAFEQKTVRVTNRNIDRDT